MEPKAYPIEPADYWELRARIRDVEAVELDILKAKLQMQQALGAAEQRKQACLATLVKKYDLPDSTFGWNDDERVLIPQEPATT